jgi:hypothetical protein
MPTATKKEHKNDQPASQSRRPDGIKRTAKKIMKNMIDCNHNLVFDWASLLPSCLPPQSFKSAKASLLILVISPGFYFNFATNFANRI